MRVFEKDVVGGVVADLELDLLLVAVFNPVQVFVQHAIPKTIGPGLAVFGAHGDAEIIGASRFEQTAI